jgi:hypothetical protein
MRKPILRVSHRKTHKTSDEKATKPARVKPLKSRDRVPKAKAP